MRRILANEQGVSAYQRAGAVPGGHHAYVGLTPVAGGMPWNDGRCTALTRTGEQCKNAADKCRHHHAKSTDEAE